MEKKKEEDNVFAQGMQGWKMLFNAVRRKKNPENQEPTLASANAG